MLKPRKQPKVGALQCFPSEINDKSWMGLHQFDGVHWRYLYEIRTEQCPIVRDNIKNLTAQIACAYVAKNSVPASELSALINNIHSSLIETSTPKIIDSNVEKKKSAASIKKTITPEAIFSLEDGKPYKTLKRHLARLGLTPEAYRAKWNLPSDYPMVASEYSKRRSELATSVGLGRKRAPAVAIVAKPRGPRNG